MSLFRHFKSAPFRHSRNVESKRMRVSMFGSRAASRRQKRTGVQMP